MSQTRMTLLRCATDYRLSLDEVRAALDYELALVA